MLQNILLPLLTTIAATNPQTLTHTNAANKKITSHNSFYKGRKVMTIKLLFIKVQNANAPKKCLCFIKTPHNRTQNQKQKN